MSILGLGQEIEKMSLERLVVASESKFNCSKKPQTLMVVRHEHRDNWKEFLMAKAGTTGAQNSVGLQPKV